MSAINTFPIFPSPNYLQVAQGTDYLSTDGTAPTVVIPSSTTTGLSSGTSVTWFTNLSYPSLTYSCVTTFSTSGANTTYTINIPRSVTTQLIPGSNYRYDIRVIVPSGDLIIVAQGKVQVLAAYPGS